jgi:hypothetical protein
MNKSKPTTAMKTKTYRYITRTAAGSGRYTTQASPRGKVTTAEVIADLAATTGQTSEQTEATLRAFCQYVIERATDSWRIEPLFDLLGFNASSGGIFDSYTISPTFDNLNLSINMVVGRSGYNLAREGFSAELVGSQGRVVPVIKGVTNKGNGTVNTYTPGQGLELNLARFGTMDAESPEQGVFLTNTSGVTVPVTSYLKTNGQTVLCIVPTGLTGPQQVSIVQNFSGENRTGVFDFLLQPASATRRGPAPLTTLGHAVAPSQSNGHGSVQGNSPAMVTRGTRPAGSLILPTTRSRSRASKAKAK